MSLVMSQVASRVSQHPNHPSMVGVEPHHDEGSEGPPSRSSVHSFSSSASTLRAPSSTAIPATPRSPAIEPRQSYPSPSSNVPPPAATSQSRTQEPREGRHEDLSRSQTTSEYSEGAHQYNRDFDQSGFPLSESRNFNSSSPNSPRLQPTYRSTRSLGGSEATSPSRIKVRDLSHIQSFASEERLHRPRGTSQAASRFGEAGTQYEISSMPVGDIIEMVAGLLTKITTTNDQQHEHVHKPIPSHEDQSNLSPQAHCVLAFHGKNVPSITILSYLSRIHKYCPTTYEVFLSLLVYFDRMTDMVNRGFLNSYDQHGSPEPVPAIRSPEAIRMDHPRPPSSTAYSTPPSSGSMQPLERQGHHSIPPSPVLPGQSDLSQFFVVDSYNIHRLVIAGVTCASKFFSDVFYTNSRYAKVGGLPLVELNHLELQFLLLNDFRLSVPVEELEAYGTMLVEFYAREIVAQQQADDTRHQQADEARRQQATDGVYMQNSSARATGASATQ